MQKIQTKGDERIQRKRRTRAMALPQLAAGKIPHSKHSERQKELMRAFSGRSK